MKVHTLDPDRKYIVILVNSNHVHRNADLVRRIRGVSTVFAYTNGMLSVYVEGRDLDEVVGHIRALQEIDSPSERSQQRLPN